MKRLLVASLMLGCSMLTSMTAEAKTQIEFWHAMGGVLNDRVTELSEKFNASQDEYEVVPVHKGNYEELINMMIAAYRAKRAPVIVQTNERAFLTMLNSSAVIPVADLMEKEGYTIDWSAVIAPVAAYYSDQGKLQALPFNSSTPILWYNEDHFKAAGYEAPSDNWDELTQQLHAIHDKGVSKCAMSLPGDYEWSFLENYSAVNDFPYGTKRNGIDGLDTEFVFNKSLGRQVERMHDLVSSGVMEIAGQGIQPVQLFTSGTCSTIIASTASHAAVEASAQFPWNATFLPHEKDRTAHNSVIGGGALWAMKGHSDEEYKGAAAFFDFLAKPETQVWWSKNTGYVPVTTTAYEALKEEGYFEKHPTRAIAIEQLMRKPNSDNSLGFRFGNSNQANVFIMEEVMAAVLGQKPAQEALDSAVTRGNEVLRRFEKLNAGK
ncbi:extracellular solute-binding protein [Falsochrobactrum ovis]|uniref:sn-glycerol-3-phosphate-binding periplasmic protein UgpB n=1 Tax=Falsochrobactrum ovis TaxID=1293442 RepID=A0A364JSG3_9HYPH|nr:extracellular solute-binding protein [Falsochrobactrum ovis]RAK26115.1 carbohydrate ABC transporter substrate-binding protein (CUT1 family) [Falsochrobactrum ovis]